MITVAEALALVIDAARSKSAQATALDEAAGLVLAADVTSNVDSPPYDKSVVDGYAVVADDLRDGAARLTILEEVVAGAVPTARVLPGTTTRIMTGAPIPAGADAVVMIERATLEGEQGGLGKVVLRDADLRAGRNILRRGAALRAGDVVLKSGTPLRAVEIGLLAEIGQTNVQAIARPRVAILPTGNELVEPEQVPAAGQIRNSNGPLLAAAVRQAGAEPAVLTIARDEEAELRRLITSGLAADVLILSGGVSAGVLDLVPRVLGELGVAQIFHKVQLKPGKPLWFGVFQNDQRRTLVFGLPGNPVSSFVCCELFVRPAIERISGRPATGLRRARAILTESYRQRGDRPTYFPGFATGGEAEPPQVRPVAWQGSADLRGLVAANALIAFPAGDRLFEPGDAVEILLLDPR